MKASRLASLFLREEATDGRLDVFLDRLLMRFFDNPSVIVYLRDAQVRKPDCDDREVEGDGVEYCDGQIELVFSQLPDEVIPQIVQVTGIHTDQIYRFKDKATGYPYIGYVFKPQDTDLDGIDV